MALTVGQQFAGYEILAELGRGGMGAVYQARQLSVQRLVALKILPPHLAANHDFITRFQSEAVAAGNLNHPNIVHVYTAGECDGIHYIAMEFVEGESIGDRLKRLGRLPLTEALDIAYHVATALDFAWSQAQLVHRDVKPDNIFLAQDGSVKLGDFGIAKMLRDGAANRTMTGHVMGSPHFISPEQARGQRDVDFRADIYSLGCALHYMMTGRAVFEGPDFVSIIYKHVNEAPEPIYTLLPSCPESIAELLERMLKKSREERPASYAEVIEAILHARTEAEEHERSALARQRAVAARRAKREAPWVYALAAAVAVVLSFAAFSYMRQTRAVAAAKVVRPVNTLADPSDRRDFIHSIERLPVSDQFDRVMDKLRELNPAFTGKARYTVEDGAITELTLPSLGLTNLWPVTALKHLRALRCTGNATNRIASELSDLTPLAETWIDELDVSWTQVEDLTPLAKLPIRRLACANTRVRDLTPLGEHWLVALDISNTAVTDLTPLKGKPLETLRCAGAPVRDFSPLQNAPLKRVWCDLPRLSAEVVRSWEALETVNDLPRLELARRLRPRAAR